MTPTELIAAFESLAEAPDGVACLRELILQLAVRGRLVEQRPGDGSASDLVQRVLAEAKGRKIRVEIVHESRKPFDAPTSWGWVHLGDAMDLFNGRAFKPADWRAEGLRIVRIQNLNDPDADYNHCDPAIDRRFCIDSGCLLLSWSGTPGTSFGAFVWQGGLAALNQHIFRCQPRADAFAIHFLRLAINSRLNEMIARAHGGVGLRHITKGKLEGLWLPVPPLAEQHRIVARVEELMGLLDRLEAARAKRETTRAAARDSVLAALRQAESPAEVDAAWTRFAQRMDDLVCDPADIAPLRQTVLQLAVRGRLVRQDPKDKPVADLAQTVVARRRTSRGQESDTALEPLFSVPNNWRWLRMDAVTDLASGVTKGRSLVGRKTTSLPYLRVANVQAGFLDLKVIKTIDVPNDEIDEGLLLRGGDVLLTEGGDWDKLGRSAIWNGEVSPCTHQNHVFRARPVGGMNSRWISMFTNSPDGRTYFQSCAKRTTNLASINMTQLRACPVPVPPAAEQHRIVARVDELTGLLDRLEQRLAATNATHAAFAAAAVHHLEPDDLPMESTAQGAGRWHSG